MDIGQKFAALGYNQITALSAAVGIGQGLANNAVPRDANYAVITPLTQGVRWRDDGVAPTASVGMPLAAGVSFTYSGNLSAIKFIQQSASAELNVSFFKIG